MRRQLYTAQQILNFIIIMSCVVNNGKSIGGLLFADEFVGMSDSREN